MTGHVLQHAGDRRRAATGLLHDPVRGRPVQGPAADPAGQIPHRGSVQRPRLDHAAGPGVLGDEQIRGQLAPPTGHHRQRLDLEPPQREPERPGRLTVHPVRIIHDQNRHVLRRMTVARPDQRRPPDLQLEEVAAIYAPSSGSAAAKGRSRSNRSQRSQTTSAAAVSLVTNSVNNAVLPIRRDRPPPPPEPARKRCLQPTPKNGKLRSTADQHGRARCGSRHLSSNVDHLGPAPGSTLGFET